MNNDIDLDNAPIKNTFFKYLLPSVFAMTIKSLFIVVDLMFVGKGVGDVGLGAISLTVPFFVISASIALMVGIGGATLMSIQFGKGNVEQGQRIFEQSALLFLLIAISLVSLSFIFLDEIVEFMGATHELAQSTKDYLGVMLVFFLFQGGQFVLAGFVRNDTNPSLAMKALMSGFLLNIVLDYVFIFEFNWGIKGGAFATGLSQLLIFSLLLTHFIRGKGKLRLKFTGGYTLSSFVKILKIGSPNFFLESTLAVTAGVFNYILLTNYSDLHVTAYSIVMNVSLVVLLAFSGMDHACQPIISYNYGKGQSDKVKAILMLGLRYSTIVGIATIVIVMLFSDHIVSMFTNNNLELIALASMALKIYLAGAIFMGLNVMTSTFFQSIEHSKYATIISVSRGLVFTVLGLLILPSVFPEYGIWASVLMAETLTVVISLSLLYKNWNRI